MGVGTNPLYLSAQTKRIHQYPASSSMLHRHQPTLETPYHPEVFLGTNLNETSIFTLPPLKGNIDEYNRSHWSPFSFTAPYHCAL